MWKLEGEGRRVVRDLMSFVELLLYNRNNILYILIYIHKYSNYDQTISFLMNMNNKNIPMVKNRSD